jgi:NtrC-family two-component system response regulator AlgB
MAIVLIIDDEKNIRSHLATYVRGLGHRAETAADAATALGLLDGFEPDVVFSDVRMAGMDGLELLREIRRRRPDAVVVLMTAYATVRGAVEAMRDGAYDYLVKPFDLDEVGLLLERVLEVRTLRRENRELRRAVEAPALLESSNPAMRRVLLTARQAAASDATILLTGESGTGKNVLASAIHGWSPRAAGPFVVVSCTTLSEHLLESELFGHVKGAFTGAWKDHPGRLETARIVAATNSDLAAEVRAGRFRQDLFYRLEVIGLALPPLRERQEDLPALIDHLVGILCARHRRAPLTLDPGARAALLRYPWPGNVRELLNALERALVLSSGETLRAEDLPDHVLAPVPASPAEPASTTSLSLDELERRQVQMVLAESATLEEAAARLGINPTTLWRKRKRWGLD